MTQLQCKVERKTMSFLLSSLFSLFSQLTLSFSNSIYGSIETRDDTDALDERESEKEDLKRNEENDSILFLFPSFLWSLQWSSIKKYKKTKKKKSKINVRLFFSFFFVFFFFILIVSMNLQVTCQPWFCDLTLCKCKSVGLSLP